MECLREKVMKKMKPWQAKEKYEKAYNYFEPFYQEGFIAKEISYYYSFNRAFMEAKESIHKKFPLPSIPNLAANEKEWQQFLDSFLKQKDLQMEEAFKVIYKGKYDISTCKKKFLFRVVLANFVVLCLVIVYFVFLFRTIRV